VVVSPFEQSDRLSLLQRCALGAAAVGLLGLWGAAAWLRPEAGGLGTHQQFGLPPCTVRVLFGLRCPTCGMTTAWASLIRGRLFAALRANATGTGLGVLSLAALPWLILSAAKGRWWLVSLTAQRLACLMGLFVSLALVEWGLRVWVFGG